MADQEVIKHTKSIYKIWHSSDHGFWHKIKEFVIEIAIIVFAVSLSIWFHSRSEHSHQQAEVKEFLVGLREDLRKDIIEMQIDSGSYVQQSKAFQYLSDVKYGEKLNADSVKNRNRYIFNSTGLLPNSGRYEGYKSSGKIGYIEDKNLQIDIFDLYQEEIPILLNSTDGYTSKKAKLHEFIAQNRKRAKQGKYNNLHEVLSLDPAINMSATLAYTEEIVQRYGDCMAKSRKIIARIEQLYPDLKM
jgi:Family of unknown function (DUF6090)